MLEAAECKPQARPATREDVAALAPTLRTQDCAEVAALGFTPELALEASFENSSQCYSIVDATNTVVAMFGVGKSVYMSDLIGEPVGAIWMLGAPGLQKIRYQFLRECHPWMETLHRDFRVLWNWADARNALHLRWLEWLGFKIIGTAPIGTGGELFHQFLRVK